MDALPEEILVDILDYLDAKDVVSTQQISPRLLELARDNSLWRSKCWEKSPSASKITNHSRALAALTGALGSLSISESSDPNSSAAGNTSERISPDTPIRISRRAKSISEWDRTNLREKIDWYSEYIARNGALSTRWLRSSDSAPEVLSLATFIDSSKAVGSREDGSVCIWDISESSNGARGFRELSRSAPSVLFDILTEAGTSSDAKSKLAFSGISEGINVDSFRCKAYIAVGAFLNEVDLHTMQLLSQSKYAWPITALSQEVQIDLPLTVGTTWSLNLYDPRAALRDRSRSPEDLLRTVPGEPEDSIAFLPNYAKARGRSSPLSPAPPGVTQWQPPLLPTGPPQPSLFGLAMPPAPRRARHPHLSDYAPIEPGPLSILHHGRDEIVIAGRFPSILSYDRRYFPRLQHVIHSGARLSALASIPQPPPGASASAGAQGTLVACGEYGGRGSLELYSLPHVKMETKRDGEDYGLAYTPDDIGAAEREHAMFRAFTDHEYPFSYKNRQEASASKLLSVATQGTRIVFSDAEGGLKWVERDGRGLVRKWNINSFETNEFGASVQGEQVVRKIIPLAVSDSARGMRGDGDLLIWTGEKIGLVSTKSGRAQAADREDEEEEEAAQKEDLADNEDDRQVAEHAKAMRTALERQADEVRWMRRFGLR